jgi:hypothetical protein
MTGRAHLSSREDYAVSHRLQYFDGGLSDVGEMKLLKVSGHSMTVRWSGSSGCVTDASHAARVSPGSVQVVQIVRQVLRRHGGVLPPRPGLAAVGKSGDGAGFADPPQSDCLASSRVSPPTST